MGNKLLKFIDEDGNKCAVPYSAIDSVTEKVDHRSRKYVELSAADLVCEVTDYTFEEICNLLEEDEEPRNSEARPENHY